MAIATNMQGNMFYIVVHAKRVSRQEATAHASAICVHFAPFLVIPLNDRVFRFFVSTETHKSPVV